MSKNKITILIATAIVALFVIITTSMFFSYNNQEVSLRKDSDAQRSKIEGVHDKMWKILQEKASVTSEYKDAFATAGITYFYTLIDDIVARVIRSPGGFIWACKNYDGDVMSDMVASAFGSLAMMSSVLVSPHGYFEYEAAHGTVTRHYYQHLKGQKTSTNSMATIFAWSGALRKRGQLDGNGELERFAQLLEKAAIDTIEKGLMTKDLGQMSTLENVRVLDSFEFLKAVRDTLAENL